MFVTFEGCEGVGKSTQLKLLKEYLIATSQPALFIREPGSTPISEQIREVILDPKNKEMTPETEALLYAASRAQLVREVILPAIMRGELVICDRFIDSSIAYQGYARGLGVDEVKKINELALCSLEPDLTVFIDLSPREAFRNGHLEDRLEQESDEFFEKVYAGYIAQSKASNGRFVHIKPDFDKNVTSNMIINAMRARGIIK